MWLGIGNQFAQILLILQRVIPQFSFIFHTILLFGKFSLLPGIKILNFREKFLLYLGKVKHILDADSACHFLWQAKVRPVPNEIVLFLKNAPQGAFRGNRGQWKHHIIVIENLPVEVGLRVNLLFLRHDVVHQFSLELFLLRDNLLMLLHEAHIFLDHLRFQLGVELEYDRFLLQAGSLLHALDDLVVGVLDELEEVCLFDLEQGDEASRHDGARVCDAKKDVLLADLVRLLLRDNLRDEQIPIGVAKFLCTLSWVE